jgi:predicted acetyltransferase
VIELKRLSPSDGIEIYDLLQSIPREENGLQNKVNGMTYEEYKQWLIGKQVESEQEGIVDGWKVPSTTYWLYVDGVPVGFGNVRIYLTEALKKVGGNIGYGIASPFRGKGYGKELLKLLLTKAKEAGIERALLTIRKDNIASQAVAYSNGGVLTETADERVYFWIDTN